MYDTVTNDINAALKAGDKAQAEALRLLKSALGNAKISLGHDLSKDEAIKVIRKEMKSRVEARDMFAQNGRQELADKEEFERTIYAKYVPEELSAEAIKGIVAEQAQGLDAPIQFSQLMPKVMQAVAGRADGRAVSEHVKQFIEGQK